METEKEWGRGNEEERWPQTKPLVAHGSHWTWITHLNFELTQVFDDIGDPTLLLLSLLLLGFYSFYSSSVLPAKRTENRRQQVCLLSLFVYLSRRRHKQSEEAVDVGSAACSGSCQHTHTHTQRDDGNGDGDCDGRLQFLNVAAAKLSHNCNALAAEFVVLHTYAHLYRHTHTLHFVNSGKRKGSDDKGEPHAANSEQKLNETNYSCC